jgi:hypothetical protein
MPPIAPEVAYHSEEIAKLLDRSETPAERMQHAAAIRLHRNAIMDTYGAVRGWRPSDAPFTLPELVAGKRQRRLIAYDPAWEAAPGGLLDHLDFWERGARTAAITVHTYSAATSASRSAIVEWALGHRLRVTFPEDFPSWWFPGRTVLVEILRGR